MGRPSTGALSSFSPLIQEEIKKLRGQHSGWGPTTLRVELQQNERLSGLRLPSRSTIGQFLLEQGLSKRYHPNTSLPLKHCPKAEQPHDHWQVDGQGNTKVPGVGPVAMLNIKDTFSSVYVNAFPAKMKSLRGHPNAADYQTAIRLGFIQHGLPKRIQTDHASVFYDNHSKSPFPTTFCLWLIGLGIQPCFSRFNQPTDQAQVERAHQTIFNQVLAGRNDYLHWEQLFDACQKRRRQLNQCIPSRSTDNLPPLQRYPKAKHSGRFYHPALEATHICLDRIYAFLAKGQWFRIVAKNRTITIGGQVYYIKGTKYRQQLRISFCPIERKLHFFGQQDTRLTTLQIKGITKQALMGDLGEFSKLQSLQLELPINWKAIKVNTTLSDSDLV